MLQLLDSFLSIFSFFDMFTPMNRWMRNVKNRPTFTFHIPRDCGKGIYTITEILKEGGCPSWGKEIYGDEMIMSCRRSNAIAGYEALLAYGIQPINAPKGIKNKPRK